jgi:hypothetical protein
MREARERRGGGGVAADAVVDEVELKEGGEGKSAKEGKGA